MRYDKCIDNCNGLHCDLEDSIAKNQMKNIVRFAQNAAAGKKIMIITHLSIKTDSYQSTKPISKYLSDSFEVKIKLCNLSDDIGIKYARGRKVSFIIRSYYSETAADHLKHLHVLDKMLKFVIAILE